MENKLSPFSGRGPSRYGLVKPEIVAPGENIYSASNESDTSYGIMSGTSTSTPFVAGIAAMLNSIKGQAQMSISDLRKVLLEGADHDVVETGKVCGGIKGIGLSLSFALLRKYVVEYYIMQLKIETCLFVTEDQFPNNNYGWGVVNAENSLKKLQK